MYNGKDQKTITLSTIRELKSRGEKIACLTAYDSTFAYQLDQAGIEIILVGDSLGMVVQGHKTTIPVKVEDMVYHSRIVSSSINHAFLISDMPFMSFYNPDIALENAKKLMQDGGAHMIKLEGNKSQINIIEKLALSDIPVCAHIGLRPQSVNKMGGYKVQGKENKEAENLINEAKRIEESGADILLLECVSSATAKKVCESVNIPIIGIGAGPDVDAQILVLYDILGITPGKLPKFSKNYMNGQNTIQQAIVDYIEEVKTQKYPSEQHSFK
ncbi:MAG: 3-methyl-2-oxobutanoate hydroxymethyltransferase [Hyphomicrobiales bacterium]|jgi:3-methyl-2-oxobutanoate hydroxymethyltransferase|nr:3-methyl-2-oxobutanoate hydroxymethyltransferase [Hyphomicrobiales bacterium]|tara:strand:- start:221 stop:1036 length:816 start_codon:yes stop_codon:yes gene_type:complete